MIAQKQRVLVARVLTAAAVDPAAANAASVKDVAAVAHDSVPVSFIVPRPIPCRVRRRQAPRGTSPAVLLQAVLCSFPYSYSLI